VVTGHLLGIESVRDRRLGAGIEIIGEGTLMRIATSRYQARDLVVASGLAPVGTTVGRPRFRLGYELAGTCREVTPYGLFGKGLSEVEFTAGYRRRLDGVGVDAIGARLGELAGDRPGVVLLCFEDVGHGAFCHRTIFRQWWLEQTGEPVEELAT
jgi:hypothetical protein